MNTLKVEQISIQNQTDIVLVRQKAKIFSLEIGLGLTDQTKVVTAASEIARNTLNYGGGGEVQLEILLRDQTQKGLRLTFQDHGPGIADLQKALTDGFTTGGGMGMGLSGSKRLMSEFEIESELGKGTRVVIIKWK